MLDILVGKIVLSTPTSEETLRNRLSYLEMKGMDLF